MSFQAREFNPADTPAYPNYAAGALSAAPDLYPTLAYRSQPDAVGSPAALAQFGGSPPYAPTATAAAPEEARQAQPAAPHLAASLGNPSGHVLSVDAGRFAGNFQRKSNATHSFAYLRLWSQLVEGGPKLAATLL